MQFPINSLAGRPISGLLTCILLFVLFTADVFGQKVTEPSYDRNKFRSYQDAKKATRGQDDAKAEMAAMRSNHFVAKPATACSGVYVPHDATYTAVPRNDDGSFGPINLGWTFSFCGNSFTQVYINTNGNLTFTGPLSQFSANGFPFGTPMVAAFWSDIDTRNAACGQIWYKLTPNYLIATWDNTGYFSMQCDKTVSFNLVISDGTLAGGLGVGNTIGFRYGNMQFTTGSASGGVGGFGGIPATVGFNSGSGTNFEQIGRFDQPGTSYDGGFGANDGVDYLDNKCFVFKSNNPPTAICKNAVIVLGPTGTTLVNPASIDNGSVDDCSALTYAVNPVSVNCADIGTKQVTLTVTDNIGQTATCVATLTVKDLQVPAIICPPNVTVSCEDPVAPANTGTPLTFDNCPVTVSHTDITIPGACTHDYTLGRTWTVKDASNNVNNCLQVIKVEDKKKPVINCPPDITVTCIITPAVTGTANATDNCDLSVAISHQDFLVYGDCDFYCITDRHWKAEDDCFNTQSCIQHITQDVTPLIEQALAAGPLVWGQDQATVTLPPGQGSCVVQWFPYTGTTPTALKFDDAVAGPPCTLMTNPLNGGRIVNPLLGEAMKLKILVRLNPGLGTTPLSSFVCNPPIHFIVRQAMAPNPDVNELLRVTDLTLGNINANLLVPQHTLYLLAVLKCVNAGKNFCNP
jgi:hypothetical protein